MFAFILSMIGLIVAICLRVISEQTFVSLFSTLMVGIGTLANPKGIAQRIKKTVSKTTPKPFPTLTEDAR